MTDLVAHRGPDGEGYTFLGGSEDRLGEVAATAPWTVGLGHRRLAILDLSDAGAQPMSLGNGDRPRHWMLYNGEIYNYVELRRELETMGRSFRSTGDSEVLLTAYDAWGTDCFRRLRGMWAVVIVDVVRHEVILSRDRLGIKPLYATRADDALVVASEIKQFTALPGSPLTADFAAVADYLVSGYERADRTFFESVESVAPATWRRIDLADLRLIAEESYWSPESIEATVDDPDAAAEALSAALLESIRLHLRSDVPIAVSLSGGLDSGSIAALLASELGETGLHTFTATFPGHPVDERRYVEHIVGGGAFRPHFVTPDPERLAEEIDAFVWHHDEPVGSLSQYAAYRIARETNGHGIAVTLNGQGGDEILAGYWQSYFSYLRRLARSGRWPRLAAELGGALLPGGNREALRQPLFLWRRYRQRRSAGGTAPQILDRVLAMSSAEQRLFEIRELFLPRLLRWDDRNLMAFSVEGRYPFLDHRVLETALTFTPRALYRAGWTKLPLRRAMSGRLPAEILRRRDKQGFETPQEHWCRGPLASILERFKASDSPVWSVVDRRQLEPRAGAPEPHQALVRALFVDRWIARFDVRIEEAA